MLLQKKNCKIQLFSQLCEVYDIMNSEFFFFLIIIIISLNSVVQSIWNNILTVCHCHTEIEKHVRITHTYTTNGRLQLLHSFHKEHSKSHCHKVSLLSDGLGKIIYFLISKNQSTNGSGQSCRAIDLRVKFDWNFTARII